MFRLKTSKTIFNCRERQNKYLSVESNRRVTMKLIYSVCLALYQNTIWGVCKEMHYHRRTKNS